MLFSDNLFDNSYQIEMIAYWTHSEMIHLSNKYLLCITKGYNCEKNILKFIPSHYLHSSVSVQTDSKAIDRPC